MTYVHLHVNERELADVLLMGIQAESEGDCGNVWSEDMEGPGCTPHVLVPDPTGEVLMWLKTEGIPFVITLADDWAEVVAISESWAENQCPHNSEARAFPSSIAALLQASSTTPTLKETHK